MFWPSISQYGLYFINVVFLFSDASVEGSGPKICICLPGSWKARVEHFGQRFNHLQKCHLCNSGQLFTSWSWWWWIDLRLLKIYEVQWRNMTFKDDNFRCRHHEYQKSLSEHYIIRLRINDFQIKKWWWFVTRPSILCVTHQMMNYKWYLMVLGQYMTILAGTWSV